MDNEMDGLDTPAFLYNAALQFCMLADEKPGL
jgi:hypothetical protein